MFSLDTADTIRLKSRIDTGYIQVVICSVLQHAGAFNKISPNVPSGINLIKFNKFNNVIGFILITVKDIELVSDPSPIPLRQVIVSGVGIVDPKLVRAFSKTGVTEVGKVSTCWWNFTVISEVPGTKRNLNFDRTKVVFNIVYTIV